MRNFKNYFSYVALVALIFTSCSKEEAAVNDPGGETATLSFASMLNNVIDDNAALKQIMEDDVLPECSDAVPAYVEVILTGPENVGSEGAPVRVDVNPTSGDYDGDGEDEYFTEYSSDLELTPGTYTLTHFVVYDSSGNMLWVAPKTGGDFAAFVETPLPFDIELDAGVKLYIDVEVLCFDDRVVNEYGYLFFDIEENEAFEFCFFINYCDDNGRHFTASYTLDLGIIDGDQLYNDVPNVVGINENELAFAEPLCIALPNLDEYADDEPYIWYEITLQDWTGVYGDVDQVIIEGTLSREEIIAHFEEDGTVNYEHLNFGCDVIEGEPTIDEDTSIYIYFDSSGSMNSTLAPLQEMRNTLLKDALLPLYGNDEATYNSQVQVISNGSERTMHFLNFENETPDGNVISLVFQDEATYVYMDNGWTENSTRTSDFDSDISTLRNRLNTFPANYYNGIIFQVATSEIGQYANFKNFVQAVQNGSGEYSGNYGLSDRAEFGYVYDVTPAASPEYYKNLIVTALQGLGYAL